MNILNQTLKTTGIRKTQTAFLNILFTLWLAIPGRINYANLERFSALNEKTFRNWFEKPIEWVHLNANLVRASQAKTRIGNRLILASNRKTGKCTPGLAKFWDSKLGKATQSLEQSCCTLIDLEYRQAIPIHALQTPAVPPEGESRVDHYAGHMQDVLGTLYPEVRAQIVCVVGDAYYAKRERPARCRLVSKKKTFVDSVTGTGKHFVSKLRMDANLRYLYNGPATGKPGRPQKYAGKVIWSDLSSWTLVSSDEFCSIRSNRAYSPALKRNVLVVCMTWFGLAGKTRREIFFSTDLLMPALEVIECYRARFEMEFAFRDTKQFAGLMDSQSRQAKALGFHWNASFAVVNLARTQALLAFDGDVREFVFSMEDATRRGYNEFFAARIIRLLPVSLSFDKCVLLLEDALNLGVKAA